MSRSKKGPKRDLWTREYGATRVVADLVERRIASGGTDNRLRREARQQAGKRCGSPRDRRLDGVPRGLLDYRTSPIWSLVRGR